MPTGGVRAVVCIVGGVIIGGRSKGAACYNAEKYVIGNLKIYS